MHGRWAMVLVSTLMLVPLAAGPHVRSPSPQPSNVERHTACSEDQAVPTPSSHLADPSAPAGPVPSSETVDDARETVEDTVDRVADETGCDGVDGPVGV